MKHDILSADDVKILVDSFYDKVVKDDLIAKYFTEIAKVNWATHMPQMYAFWNGVLLGEPGFTGRPMMKHIKVHYQEPIESQHIDRWIQLWHETLDALFEGPTVSEAKRRAGLMRELMLFKFEQASKPGFIQ